MRKIIAEKMKEKKISQGELGRICGVKQQYISKILKGDVKSPSFELVVKIADALGVSLDELR